MTVWGVAALVGVFGLVPAEAFAAPTPTDCSDRNYDVVSGRVEQIQVFCYPWFWPDQQMWVVDGPDHGSLTLEPTASYFRYRSDEGFVGTDSFEVAASDRDHPEGRHGTVTLNVIANTPPVCRDVSFDVMGDGGLSGTIVPRCSDPESRLIAPPDTEVVTPPQKGLLDPRWRYSPGVGARGEDVFTLRYRDGYLFSNTVTVRANILTPKPPLQQGIPSQRSTFLLSRSYLGGLPDGPSRNGVVSHDQRIARVMAFESDATDIVPGDVNGKTDVYLVPRVPPWGRDGTPWTAGRPVLASTGMRGRPADGNSYRPALDGDSRHAPRCLAFVSEATNLVPGDRNGRADAFLRDLATGKTTRISLGTARRELRSATSAVSLDGDCGRAIFVTGGRLFLRLLHARRTLSLKGLGGRRPNGPIREATIARNGESVVFSSKATNLDRLDRSRTADVYRAAVSQRAFGRPRLISRTRDGTPGDGPSTAPVSDDFGRHVAFATRATNLVAGDGNGASDVLRSAAGKAPVHEWVSKEGNGPSGSPSITGAGGFVLFESKATNLRQKERSRDTNGVGDVFLWNRRTRNVSRESRGAANEDLQADSEAPFASSRGNYVTFESLWPLVDAPALDTSFPGWSADAAIYRRAAALTTSPRARQVYVRYLGPK